ncbi:MAG: PepSY domain-containing protein [Xanthobacteraceae bacterium]
MHFVFRSALFAATIALTGTGVAPLPTHARDGHDAVRQAVERGDIRSLADILTAIRDRLPGEVAGVEIEQKNGRWLYEFRVVDRKGRLFEVYVDAQTAEIQRIEEK